MTTRNPVNNNNTYYKNQEAITCSTCSPDPGLKAMLVCFPLIPYTQIVTSKLVILVTISLTIIVNLNHYAICFEWCAQEGSDHNTSSFPHDYSGYE